MLGKCFFALPDQPLWLELILQPRETELRLAQFSSPELCNSSQKVCISLRNQQHWANRVHLVNTCPRTGKHMISVITSNTICQAGSSNLLNKKGSLKSFLSKYTFHLPNKSKDQNTNLETCLLSPDFT